MKRTLCVVALLTLIALLSVPVSAHEGHNDSSEIGVVDGISYDENLNSVSEPYTKPEIERLVARSAARVEKIRNRNFRSVPEVTIQQREDFQGFNGTSSDPEQTRWNNIVWESSFIVGNDSNVNEEIRTLTASGALGYYEPSTGKIVLLTDSSTDTVREIPGSTLVHELTHALQDQYYDISQQKYVGQTQDEQLSVDGMLEGEAIYVTSQYEQKCNSNWSCVSGSSSPGSGITDINFGVYITVIFPYSNGENYVEELYQSDGWSRVDTALRDPPNKTATIINRDISENYSSETKERLYIPRTQLEGWGRFSTDYGYQGGDSLGQATVSTMFWYQNRTYGADTVPPIAIRQTRQGVQFNYSVRYADGLVNDRVVPYKSGSQNGYVWRTDWENEAEADEFLSGYRAIIEAHDGKAKNRTWHIQSGPYDGWFNVTKSGTTVYVSHGPSKKVADGLLSVSSNEENPIDPPKNLPKDGPSLPSISMQQSISIIVVLGLIAIIAVPIVRDR